MRRLEDRGDERGSRTESSGSVYTDGSDDDSDAENENENCNSPTCGDTNLCAICRCEYLVNQELCWSQDPLCNHVFHRGCMQTWILDHDYCPLCDSQSDDITTVSVSSAGPTAANLDAEDVEPATSELFFDTKKRVVSNLEMDEKDETASTVGRDNGLRSEECEALTVISVQGEKPDPRLSIGVKPPALLVSISEQHSVVTKDFIE